MKAWQKWILVLAVCTALLTAALILGGGPMRRMRSYVLANRATLDAFAQECLAHGAPYDVALDGRRVSVPDNYPDMVVIAWFGSGLTPSSRYYELYYTADGAPHPCPGMEQYPETDTMFSFRWDEPDGDNGCLVEHIDGNWYYVESWF